MEFEFRFNFMKGSIFFHPGLLKKFCLLWSRYIIRFNFPLFGETIPSLGYKNPIGSDLKLHWQVFACADYKADWKMARYNRQIMDIRVTD